MNNLVQYNTARQNLQSWFRLTSILMLVSGAAVIPVGILAALFPGVVLLAALPSLALFACVMAFLRARAGIAIDTLAIRNCQELSTAEAKLDLELAQADPALGIALRAGEKP